MRRIALAATLLFFSCVTGCNVSDAIFGVFGDHYSGGGVTAEDRKNDYDHQVEKWDNFQQYGESR